MLLTIRFIGQPGRPPGESCLVQIKDININTSSFANLFQSKSDFNVVETGKKLVFFTPGSGLGGATNIRHLR